MNSQGAKKPLSQRTAKRDRWILFILLVSLLLPTFALAEQNVILLTLDGVRWQEFFYGIDRQNNNGVGGDTFPLFWKNYATESLVLGDFPKQIRMYTSNATQLSLPAYQSIMAGSDQGCWTNICGRIGVETVAERIKKQLHLSKKEVAVISSWERIANAAEHIEGSVFVNAGQQYLFDDIGVSELIDINRRQEKDPPSEWGSARLDKYTWMQAMRYLKYHRPRFFWISLNDADEWGHNGNYRNYVSALRQYDVWINELFVKLDSMREYGKDTTVIIVTDHGRGDGTSWGSHGPLYPESQYIWMVVRNAFTRETRNIQGHDGYHHSDIRPSIEKLLNLVPTNCPTCGSFVREIFAH
ncbi:MAG: hypothetical protein AB7F43_06070 [Bacteriovoracia bacterium]